MIDVRPLADESCPSCGQECTLQRVAAPVYHPQDDQTPRTPLRTGRWRGTCAVCGDFECGGDAGLTQRSRKTALFEDCDVDWPHARTGGHPTR